MKVSKLFCYSHILINRGITTVSIKVVITMGYGCYGGYGYGGGYGMGSSFALIVVLFILLIIIGATIWSGY